MGHRPGPLQHLRREHALLLHRRQAAREHRLADQRHRHAQVERADASPLAGALLAGRVENLVDDRRAVLVQLAEDVARDLDQVAVQFARVPLREDVVQLGRRQPQPVLQHLIGLADELHVAVFDAVVDHLHVVPGAVLADPLAAWRAVYLGRDRLEDLLHVRPRQRVAAGHDRRAVARALFAARDARADEQDAFFGQRLGAPRRVREVRVAAVDDDVAGLQVRHQLVDHVVHRLAGLDHQHHAPRPLQQPGQLLDRVCAGDRACPWPRWRGNRPPWKRSG